MRGAGGRPFRPAERGMGYVEVLLAVAVMGLAFLPVLGLLFAGLDGNAAARHLSTATFLAQEEIESLRNMPFAEITSRGRAEVDGFPGYWRRVEVAEGPAGLKEVAVTVEWEVKGRASAVRLATLVGKR